jgi:hypothetical protein
MGLFFFLAAQWGGDGAERVLCLELVAGEWGIGVRLKRRRLMSLIGQY